MWKVLGRKLVVGLCQNVRLALIWNQAKLHILNYIFSLNLELQHFIPVKALPGFFLCIFSAHLPASRNLFSASGFLGGGSYQPPCHYFYKVKKSQLCFYIGKGPEYTGPCVLFWPVPLAYSPQGQISNHGRACTRALLLYINNNTFHYFTDNKGLEVEKRFGGGWKKHPKWGQSEWAPTNSPWNHKSRKLGIFARLHHTAHSYDQT